MLRRPSTGPKGPRCPPAFGWTGWRTVLLFSYGKGASHVLPGPAHLWSGPSPVEEKTEASNSQLFEMFRVRPPVGPTPVLPWRSMFLAPVSCLHVLPLKIGACRLEI